MPNVVAWRDTSSPVALDILALDLPTGPMLGDVSPAVDFLTSPPAGTLNWYLSGWAEDRSKAGFVTSNRRNASAGAAVMDFKSGVMSALPTADLTDQDFFTLRVSSTGAFAVLDTGTTVSGPNTVHFYDLSDNARITSTPTFLDYANAIAFSPDDSLVAVSSANPVFQVLNTSTWAAVTLGTAFPVEASFIRFSPDGTQCVVGGYSSNYLVVYDTATWNYTVPTSQPPDRLLGDWSRFSPNGAYFLGQIPYGGGLVLYDTSDWSLVRTFTGTTPINISQKSDALVLDDGTVVVSLSEASNTQMRVRFYDPVANVETGTPVELPSTPAWGYALLHGHIARVTTGASGEVTGADALPKSATVRMYDRVSGALLVQTTSDVTGKFDTADVAIPVPAYPELDVVLLDNSTPALNDLIYRLTP